MHELINHVTYGAPVYMIQDNSFTDDAVPWVNFKSHNKDGVKTFSN